MMSTAYAILYNKVLCRLVYISNEANLLADNCPGQTICKQQLEGIQKACDDLIGTFNTFSKLFGGTEELEG